MALTNEQQKIVDYARAGKGDLLIEALAGTGKTYTLLQCLEVIPQKSILVCAFNKRIQTEISKKLPKWSRGRPVVHVKTFHAIGLSIVQHHFRAGVKIDGDVTEELVNQAIDAAGQRRIPQKVRWAAIKLVRMYKETELPSGLPFDVGRLDPEELEAIGNDYQLFDRLDGSQIEQAIELALRAYELSCEQLREPARGLRIDFCDMIWIPLVLNLPPQSRYQAVIVDEWQDLNAPQFELVKRLVAPSGRMIMAGDFHQQIYQWRGSIADEVRDELDKRGPRMPLTTTFRCSKAVSLEAGKLVFAFHCLPDADDGSVGEIGIVDLPRALAQYQVPPGTIHTFVLSRTNADLLDCALMLWRERVRFQLNSGQDMLAPLYFLLDYVLKLDSVGAFLSSLKDWEAKEIAKAERANATTRLSRVVEQARMLRAVSNYVNQPNQIRGLLESIMESNDSGVLLSTVHKVKGLEAERVYLLKQTFAQYRPIAVDRGETVATLPRLVTQEDLNIEYVAVTRAMLHLRWVDLKAKDQRSFVVTFEDGSPFPLGGGNVDGLSVDQLVEVINELADEAVRLESVGSPLVKDYESRLVELRAALTKKQGGR